MLCSDNPQIGFSVGAASCNPTGRLVCDLFALSPLTGKIRGSRSFMNFPWGRKWLVMQNKLNSLGKKRLLPLWWFHLCGESDFPSSTEVWSLRLILPQVRLLSTARGLIIGWDSRNSRETVAVQSLTSWTQVFRFISNICCPSTPHHPRQKRLVSIWRPKKSRL